MLPPSLLQVDSCVLVGMEFELPSCIRFRSSPIVGRSVARHHLSQSSSLSHTQIPTHSLLLLCFFPPRAVKEAAAAAALEWGGFSPLLDCQQKKKTNFWCRLSRFQQYICRTNPHTHTHTIDLHSCLHFGSRKKKLKAASRGGKNEFTMNSYFFSRFTSRRKRKAQNDRSRRRRFLGHTKPKTGWVAHTVKSGFNEWPLSAPFHSLNRGFTLNQDF